MSTPFIPLAITGGWACPCRDAYGSAARLKEVPFSGEQMGETTIRTFKCDQNRDCWQQLTTPDGSIEWLYLGRPIPAESSS